MPPNIQHNLRIESKSGMVKYSSEDSAMWPISFVIDGEETNQISVDLARTLLADLAEVLEAVDKEKGKV